MTTIASNLPTPGGANWDAGDYLQLPPRKLLPNPDNPRKRFDPAALRAMADSMEANGVAQPLVVRPLPLELLPDTLTDPATGQMLAPSDRPAYQIVAGERRWRAATLANLATVPVVVRRLTDPQVHVLMTVENLQREDLSPLEEAEGLRQLMQATDATAEAVGKSIGRSKAYVYQALKLLDLCPEARDKLQAGQLDKAVASYLGRLPDHKLQLRALQDVAGDDAHGATPYRQAVHQIQTHYLLRLDRAPFDTAERTGWTGDAPACTACPHRTGHTADLFAEKDGPDMCLQPECYRAKESTAQAHRLQRAKDDGVHIITGREAKAIMPASWTGRVEGHLRLDDAEDSPTKRPLRDIVAAEMAETGTKETLVENPGKPGELIAVLPVATAQELLDRVAAKAKAKKDIEAAQALSAKARNEAERAEEKAREAEERKAKEAYESAWRREALLQVWSTAQANPKALGSDVLKALCRVVLGTLNSAERAELCKLLDVGKVAPVEALKERIDAQANAAPMLITLLAAKGVVWESWHDGGTHVDPHLLTALAEFGLTAQAAQAEARRKISIIRKAAAATPAPSASFTGGEGKPKTNQKPSKRTASAAHRPTLSAQEASTGIAAAMQSLESQAALPPGAAPIDPPAALANQDATATHADIATEPGAASSATQPAGLAIGLQVRVLATATGSRQAPMVGLHGVVHRQVGPRAWDVQFPGKKHRPNVPQWVCFDESELEVLA